MTLRGFFLATVVMAGWGGMGGVHLASMVSRAAPAREPAIESISADDSIAISPAVRIQPQAMDYLGNVVVVPAVWRIDVRIWSRSPARRFTIALAEDPDALRAISAGILNAIEPAVIGRKSGRRPRPARGRKGPAAWADTLGCRLSWITARAARDDRPDGGGRYVLVASALADSATLSEKEWIGLFDAAGVSRTVRRLEGLR